MADLIIKNLHVAVDGTEILSGIEIYEQLNSLLTGGQLHDASSGMTFVPNSSSCAIASAWGRPPG